jgi:hypothetical protein
LKIRLSETVESPLPSGDRYQNSRSAVFKIFILGISDAPTKTQTKLSLSLFSSLSFLSSLLPSPISHLLSFSFISLHKYLSFLSFLPILSLFSLSLSLSLSLLSFL